MLKDKVRTLSYLRAIEQNVDYFTDKIVLDVGCGTGILSMFAAKIGKAKKVYAIECSSIAIQCQQIVIDNDLSDVIQVFHGKMEEITLPTDYVDIIISEWMGYFLLYESMLGTVLYARDRYLRPNTGIILPDRAVLYLCLIEDGEYRHDKIDFWDNVYGFNMTVIKDIALTEPLIDYVDAKQIISNVSPVLTLDLSTCSIDDLQFQSDFKLTTSVNTFCQAIVGYFECAFTQIPHPVVFSTSPYHKYTHWKQTVFYLPEVLDCQSNEEINGKITVNSNERNPRDLDIKFNIDFKGNKMLSNTEKIYRLR
eukprot:gene18967-24778_t